MYDINGKLISTVKLQEQSRCAVKPSFHSQYITGCYVTQYLNFDNYFTSGDRIPNFIH